MTEEDASEPDDTTVGAQDVEVNEESLEDESESNEPNVIDPGDFSTLELTLEEARRQYDDEERRRAAVENKIGIVVTVDALLISFGALFVQNLHPLLLVVVMAPALVSAGIGLWAIRSRDYDRPGKPILDFHDYSEFDDGDSQREQLLLDYEITTGKNKKKNDPKFEYFNWCILLTFLTLALVLTTPVAQQFGIDNWLVNLGKRVIDFFIEMAPDWMTGGHDSHSADNSTMVKSMTTT